jgi:hypothetical protein
LSRGARAARANMYRDVHQSTRTLLRKDLSSYLFSGAKSVMVSAMGQKDISYLYDLDPII